MPFSRSQWLFPIAVTLHNTEEAIWLPKWVDQHIPMHVSASAFRFGILVLTVAAFVVRYLSSRHGKQSLWAYLLFGYIVAMLVNVFAPHVPASIIFRSYTPGVITAVLINLPVMSGLAVAAVCDGWVTRWRALLFAILVPVCLGISISILLSVGSLCG